MFGKVISEPKGDVQISFGYQCDFTEKDHYNAPKGIDIPLPNLSRRTSSSFSWLSGAGLSANATLANTNICNGVIGEEILPNLDSPTSFRRIPSSPSLSKLDFLSSSLQSSMSNLSCSPSTPTELHDSDSFSPKSTSFPRTDGFLSAVEVEIAGGAAGEDRVQAVCSEENGWLFCGIYDGFNGRDAADYLAGTLYETIGYHLNQLDMEVEHQLSDMKRGVSQDVEMFAYAGSVEPKNSGDSYKERVLSSLHNAVLQAENDFLRMVEQEMDVRPDLVSIGTCVLVSLLVGKNLYVMNIGDSRAVLATCARNNDTNSSEGLAAIQLCDTHCVDDDEERARIICDHPDDPEVFYNQKLKGKLLVTRALGVGYLKKKNLNEALIGILKVRDLCSPPYVTVDPSLRVHEISDSDLFVILGSDGLFDFFSNDEAVTLVHSYISTDPYGDPAKYLVEMLLIRAAKRAGLTPEDLKSAPAGYRRKYHDDVTVIVVILGMNTRTLKATTR